MFHLLLINPDHRIRHVQTEIPTGLLLFVILCPLCKDRRVFISSLLNKKLLCRINKKLLFLLCVEWVCEDYRESAKRKKDSSPVSDFTITSLGARFCTPLSRFCAFTTHCLLPTLNWLTNECYRISSNWWLPK